MKVRLFAIILVTAFVFSGIPLNQISDCFMQCCKDELEEEPHTSSLISCCSPTDKKQEIHEEISLRDFTKAEPSRSDSRADFNCTLGNCRARISIITGNDVDHSFKAFPTLLNVHNDSAFVRSTVNDRPLNSHAFCKPPIFLMAAQFLC